jgi:hypothetical protein
MDSHEHAPVEAGVACLERAVAGVVVKIHARIMPDAAQPVSPFSDLNALASIRDRRSVRRYYRSLHPREESDEAILSVDLAR